MTNHMGVAVSTPDISQIYMGEFFVLISLFLHKNRSSDIRGEVLTPDAGLLEFYSLPFDVSPSTESVEYPRHIWGKLNSSPNKAEI